MHANAGYCWDTGAGRVSKSWGVDCPIDHTVFGALFGTTTTWCGTFFYPGNTNQMDVGQNFDIWPYQAPWAVEHHWIRWTAYSDGTVGNLRAG